MSTAALRQEALSLVSSLSDADLRVVIHIMHDLPHASTDEILAAKLHTHLDSLPSAGYVDYTTPGQAITTQDLRGMHERARQQVAAGEFMTLSQQEAALADIFS